MSRNRVSLDFARPLADFEEFTVPVVALNGILHRHPVRPVNLDGPLADPRGRFRGVKFGHRRLLDVRQARIGKTRQPDVPAIRAGINLNDLGLTDPTRQGKSVWVDAVSGTAVRNGLPASVSRA